MQAVKVRGKRTATRAEKWNYAKQRPSHLERPREDRSGSSSHSTSVSSRRRKRVRRELSAFEQLPVEIIQHILHFSANLDLPGCSPTLLQQLSNSHMFQSLATSILRPALAKARRSEVNEKDWLQEVFLSSDDITHTIRLLNSRFCTWSFFSKWLRTEYALKYPESALSHPQYGATNGSRIESQLWSDLGGRFLHVIPSKLLTGPWTDEKIQFLSVLVTSSTLFAPLDTSSYNETNDLVQRGLEDAVEECKPEAVYLLCRLGHDVDRYLLRKAVTECGCDKTMVATITWCTVYLASMSRVTRVVNTKQRLQDVEMVLSDSMVWSWIERAKERSDEKGEWLLDLLRQARATLKLDEASSAANETVRLAALYGVTIEQ